MVCSPHKSQILSASLPSHKLYKLKYKRAKLKSPELTETLPRIVTWLFMEFEHVKEPNAFVPFNYFLKILSFFKLSHWY